MTTSGTTSDNRGYNEREKMTSRMTTNDNEWQWVVLLANFPLNIEEDLEERLLNEE